jgi:hypothetical protein
MRLCGQAPEWLSDISTQVCVRVGTQARTRTPDTYVARLFPATSDANVPQLLTASGARLDARRGSSAPAPAPAPAPPPPPPRNTRSLDRGNSGLGPGDRGEAKRPGERGEAVQCGDAARWGEAARRGEGARRGDAVRCDAGDCGVWYVLGFRAESLG